MKLAAMNGGRRWTSTVKIKAILENDELEPQESMNLIAKKIKRSGAFSEILCEEIQTAADENDVEWFDDVLSAAYEEADEKGIWMGP